MNSEVCNISTHSEVISNCNEFFVGAFKEYEEEMNELNDFEDILRGIRKEYEANGMQKVVMSDTEDGYKSGGSSISDKTYMINNLEKRSRRYPSVSIDLIDIENKKMK
jgi:hypothetical protein